MGTLLIIFKGIVIFEPWVGVGFGEGIVHWHYTTVKIKYTSFNCYFKLTKKGLKYFPNFFNILMLKELKINLTNIYKYGTLLFV